MEEPSSSKNDILFTFALICRGKMISYVIITLMMDHYQPFMKVIVLLIFIFVPDLHPTLRFVEVFIKSYSAQYYFESLQSHGYAQLGFPYAKHLLKTFWFCWNPSECVKRFTWRIIRMCITENPFCICKIILSLCKKDILASRATLWTHLVYWATTAKIILIGMYFQRS